MKKIFLIRHAKSDWSIQGIDDIDRPLNERGYADARRMAKQLLSIDLDRSLFISSPAVRAISTALIIARGVNYPQEKILIYPELYEAEPGVYEELLLSLNDQYQSVYIFGHNPTISRVVEQLSSSSIGDVPTCAVSIINFEPDKWAETIGSVGKIEKQIYPKMLTE